MKKKTEDSIRRLISSDPTILAEFVEPAMAILNGTPVTRDCRTQVLTRREVMKRLRIHRRTLDYYLANGHMDRVYGSGKRAIGISLASYIRFTTRHRSRRLSPAAKGRSRT